MMTDHRWLAIEPLPSARPDRFETSGGQMKTALPIDVDDEVSPPHHMSRYLLAVGLVVMLAGLLFGYDQGVISGALNGIEKSFHPSTFVIEIITSWVTLGAMAGARWRPAR
jgi:hypothetical protein